MDDQEQPTRPVSPLRQRMIQELICARHCTHRSRWRPLLWPSRVPEAGTRPAPPLRRRHSMCGRGLPPGACHRRRHPIHEPQGRLPGKCADGELLTHPENRASESSPPCDKGRGEAGPVRIHRGLLQSPPSALGHRLHQPRRDGTQSGLTPSTFRGRSAHA